MTKKKEEYRFVELGKFCGGYDQQEIPEGATHVEANINYDGCYYESDTPSIELIFYKKEKV